MPNVEKKENRRSLLNRVTPGDRVRLREDAFEHVRKREWIYKGIEKDGSILLMHENESYGLVVKEDDIDWETHQKVSPAPTNPSQNEG